MNITNFNLDKEAAKGVQYKKLKLHMLMLKHKLGFQAYYYCSS